MRLTNLPRQCQTPIVWGPISDTGATYCSTLEGTTFRLFIQVQTHQIIVTAFDSRFCLDNFFPPFWTQIFPSVVSADLEFVKSITRVRFQNFSILPEKTRKLQIFWPTIKNGACFTHLFWTICLVCLFVCLVQLFTQIQIHASCFVKSLAWIQQILQVGYFFALI